MTSSSSRSGGSARAGGGAAGGALGAGAATEGVLAMVRGFREQDDETPVVLMGYYNPVLSHGVERFCAAAASAAASRSADS